MRSPSTISATSILQSQLYTKVAKESTLIQTFMFTQSKALTPATSLTLQKPQTLALKSIADQLTKTALSLKMATLKELVTTIKM